MKKYRVVIIQEIFVEANSKEEAEKKFSYSNLGKLDKEVADGEIFHHEFVTVKEVEEVEEEKFAS